MIRIKKTSNADSRTCDATKVSKDELAANSISHRRDVKKGMYFIADLIKKAGVMHDYTKITDLDKFYEIFHKGVSNEEFMGSEWYQKHIHEERHHLNSHIPDDVDLIDVMEHLVDCTMAGLGRSGELNKEYLTLDNDLLEKAYWNTVQLLADEVEIVGE